jgi:hypothetical protein
MDLSSSNSRPAGTAEVDLVETVAQAVTGLVELTERIPGRPGQREQIAKVLDRIGEECAESAARLRALPGLPRDVPRYTFAAAAAVMAAAETEHDFGGWLAAILCQAAAVLGSSAHLVMGRSGSWEAEHVLALVRGTAGWQDEHLGNYRQEDGTASRD